MTRNVHHECPPNCRRDSLVLEQLQYIEQVTWVLTIQSGRKLATVRVLERCNRQLKSAFNTSLACGVSAAIRTGLTVPRMTVFT